MIIILDTNVIQSDYYMNSGRFAILFDYVQKTKSKFVLPKIVIDELTANYEREFISRFNQYLRSKGSFIALYHKKFPEINITIKDEVKYYIDYVKNKFKVKDKEIYNYKESYLNDVIERAIRRRRPCSDRGEEIRDAILWLSILDIAQEIPDKTVTFISQNKKQFALGDDELHPDLKQECSDRDITIRYFSSLDNFAKYHASIIDFITEEWILASIGVDEILEESFDIIESFAERELDYELSNSFRYHDSAERSSTGYFKLIQGSLDVQNFYVYEMNDNSLRIEAILEGEIEVECEVEKVLKREEYDHDYEYDSSSQEYEYIPVMRQRKEINHEYIYVYPEVLLNIEILVRDRKISKWKVINE